MLKPISMVVSVDLNRFKMAMDFQLNTFNHLVMLMTKLESVN